MEPRWLISYTPGSWIVLAGPTAVVALDPGDRPDDGLVGDLWSRVRAGVAMRDLITHLTRIEYGVLPRLAVLFLEAGASSGDAAVAADGLRALLRGPVRVLSETGQTIAHGEDVLTWQEVRLAALDRLEVDLGGGPGEALPLQLGGVRAGRLRMVAATGVPEEAVATADLPPDAPEPPAPAPEPLADDTPPRPVAAESPSPAVEEMEGADTELMFLPAPESEAPPAVARLRAPDGTSVDLDRPVLIGRAPSNAGFENSQPHLLTVLSPSQDISRTHVLVAPEGDVIVVTDLHSTNGTTVVRPGPGVEREALPSGQSVEVEVGTVLELGDEVAILVDTAP